MPVMFNAAQADQDAQLYKSRNIENSKRQLELENAQQDAKDQEVIRQTAKAAIDPNTGQYDLARHVQALQQAGFPEVAQKFQQQSIQGMADAYDTLNKAIPTTTEANWPQVRGELIKRGLPQNALPEKFDPQLLTVLKDHLGVAVKKYGPYEKQAALPGGDVLYGQQNQLTGEVQNERVLNPRNASRAWGAGHMPAAVVSKQQFADALGISLGDYLRWEANAKQAGPDRVYADVFKSALGATMGDQQAADEIAQGVLKSIFGMDASPLRRSKLPPGQTPQPSTSGAPLDPLGIRKPGLGKP